MKPICSLPEANAGLAVIDHDAAGEMLARAFLEDLYGGLVMPEPGENLCKEGLHDSDLSGSIPMVCIPGQDFSADSMASASFPRPMWI